MSVHPSGPSTSSPPRSTPPDALPEVDVRERGRTKDGQPQYAERRLFMQLLVFRSVPERALGAASDAARDGATSQVGGASSEELSPSAWLARALGDAAVNAVLYDDANDPHSIGVLTWSEDPADFIKKVRPVLARPAPGFTLTLRPEFTMLGRTYATGYETDLSYWLLERPAQTVLDEAHPWAIWYPLRRSGAFARLTASEQGAVLREHGLIGRAYAAQDLAHDVRLACHGLDARDNEFVIGLVGRELHPLSHIVENMRKTRQTSEFVSQMGPFFVGYAAHRTARR